MSKQFKAKLLLTTTLLSFLSFSIFAALLPSVHAAEITTQQKGIAILNDVVSLDLAKYTISFKEYPQDSYQGVLPQEHVRYTLRSDGSKLKIICTFTNGTLQMIDVLEHEGSPHMTKSATNALEMANDFLTNYQTFSKNSLYWELRSMLDNVDISKNSTKTSGTIKLEVTSIQNTLTFTWIYSINGVDAGPKFVALSFADGFLKSFVDHWNLYKIGSTNINLSEQAA